MRCQIFSRPWSFLPGVLPLMTRSEPGSRGKAARGDWAGSFRNTRFRPVLLSGRTSSERSRYTSDQRRFRISSRRQPVTISRRTAATAGARVRRSISNRSRVVRRRCSSSGVRYRSCRPSGNFSMPVHGLRCSATISQAIAFLMSVRTGESAWLARVGVSRREPWKRSMSARESSLKSIVRNLSG